MGVLKSWRTISADNLEVVPFCIDRDHVQLQPPVLFTNVHLVPFQGHMTGTCLLLIILKSIPKASHNVGLPLAIRERYRMGMLRSWRTISRSYPSVSIAITSNCFGVQGSGFSVQCSGFRVQDSGFRVQGLGFRVQSLGFRVQGSGFSFFPSRFRPFYLCYLIQSKCVALRYWGYRGTSVTRKRFRTISKPVFQI